MSQKDNVEGGPTDEENTEPVLSQDIDAVYTGQSCYSDLDASAILSGQRADAEESFDPDATFLDLPPTCETHDNDTNVAEVSLACVNSRTDSNVSTQPVTQSQETKGYSIDEKVNLSSELPSPTEYCQTENSTEVKQISSRTEQAGLTSASLTMSSSSSSSNVVSSSSSSKRPTDSDDTDDITMGSQDMFASQGSRCGSQNATSVSQLVPTLQLSGDIPLSQGYEGFAPPRLHPSSPTSTSTSTPRRCTDKVAFADFKSEIISISDEEDVQKMSDKRKLSDSSDDCKSEKNRSKKRCVDNRQSIMVVGEYNSLTKTSSFINSEDPDLGSQGISLHLSQSDLELTEGPNTPSPPASCRQGKSNVDLTNKISSPLDSFTTPGNDDSIVQVEIEDEVQFVPSAIAQTKTGEIILDSPQTGLSTSADIQVLTPRGENVLQEKSAKEDVKSICGSKIDRSPLRNRIVNHSSPFIEPSKLSNPQLHSSMGNVSQDLDGSKENIRPAKHDDVQEFKTDCVITLSFTVRLSCETEIDMLKKETVKNHVRVFDVLEKNVVVVEKSDSSSSAVEESSPGRSAGSPASTVSGPGPFPLLPSRAARQSIMSTTSSSSAASSATSYARPPADRRGRGNTNLSRWKGKESPVGDGATPWQILLRRDQDELVTATSDFLENWTFSCMSNCSSDESKNTIEEQALDSVPENDGEEVLGVPKSARQQHAKHLPKNAVLHSSDTGYSSLATGSSSKTMENDLEMKQAPLHAECNTPPASRRKRGRPPKSDTPIGTPKSSTKKKAPTPKSRGREKAVTAVELSSVPEDSLSSGSLGFTPGSQVFALWADKRYYPGHVKSAARGDHWNIVFHDGKQYTVSKNNVIVINTFEIGQSVSAAMGNGDYEAGTVISVDPIANGEEVYTVQLLGSKREVPVRMSDVMLSKKQMEQFSFDCQGSTFSASSSPNKKSSASKSCGSDREILKNLDILHNLPGKRVRTPKGSQNVSSPSRPGPSNTARKLIHDSAVDESTAEDEPLASTLPGPFTIVTGVEPEQVGFGSADPLARKGKGVKNRTCKKPLPEIEDEKTIQELGPIPPEGSKIFSGYTFLLTYTEVKPRPKTNPTSDSDMPTTDNEDPAGSDASSQYPSDSECFKPTHYPMVKDRLSRQISRGGGRILKHWTEIIPNNINSTFVVSDRPCLTPIYLHCLARGIKGVMHDYIIDCCKQNERCKIDQRFYLAFGYSYIKKDWVTWAAHKSKSLLKKEKIVVIGNDREFESFWVDLLKVAGATPAKVKELSAPSTVTMVLAENRNDQTKLNVAFNQNIPVVSPGWLTQSLISNKPLPYDALPWFAYDYVDLD